VTGHRLHPAGLVLAALGVASLGQMMQLVALNVLILDRTHSAPAVAILWIVPQAAIGATGTFVGRLTDHWDKRRTLIFCNLLAGLVVLTIPGLQVLWAVYAAVGVVAALDGVFRSAFTPYFRLLVPKEARTRANAVRGVLQYGALVAGPALAGAILIRGQPNAVLWINAGLLLTSGALLWWTPTLNAVEDYEDGLGSQPWRRWQADWTMVTQFLRERPVVMAVLLLFNLAIVFGSAADAQEVVFVHRALGMSAASYGALVSVAGVGYLCGAGVSWLLAHRVSLRWMVGAGGALAALGYLGYALSYNFDAAAAGLMGLGLFQALASTGFAAFTQGALPPERMGRILSTVRAGVAVLTIAATLAGGWMVGQTGVRPMMVLASGFMVLVGAGLGVVCASRAAGSAFVAAAAS